MRIKNITHADTGKTRTDGEYPNRIGCEVALWGPIECDQPMILRYITDKDGNPKHGGLITSWVAGWIENEDGDILQVATMNSIYEFDYVKD